MAVSITAAASARLRATSSVLPSGLTAMSRGQERWTVGFGGKFCTAGAPLGGGTGMIPALEAMPVFGSYVRTWTTSPSRPGTLGSTCSSVWEESLSPDT